MLNPNQAFLLVQKLKSAPRALFTLGLKAELEKIFSICPKLLINAELYGLVLAPRLGLDIGGWISIQLGLASNEKLSGGNMDSMDGIIRPSKRNHGQLVPMIFFFWERNSNLMLQKNWGSEHPMEKKKTDCFALVSSLYPLDGGFSSLNNFDAPLVGWWG
jgi:hypothetical protein